IGARVAPHGRSFNATIVMPTAFLVYAALALIGPLAAGGGNELFPADELVPHPVRPGTMFLASLLLAPLNIAWVGQTTTLVALTAYVAGSWHGLPAALAVAVAFIATTTVCGQAVAWGVAGLRQSVWGRRLVWLVGGAAALTVLAVAHIGLTRFLDRAPTRPVVIALLQGANGFYSRWALTLTVLLFLCAAGGIAGFRTTSYTLRRPPGLMAERQAKPVPRRHVRRSIGSQL